MSRQSLKHYCAVVSLVACCCFCSLSQAQVEFKVSDITSTPGTQATITVFLTNDAPVQGFQTALTFDNANLTLDSMDTTGLGIESALAPATVEFFLTNINNTIQPTLGWGAVAAIFDSSLPFEGQTLPPGTNQSIVNYRFSVTNNPLLVGGTTTLQLQNGFGPPPGINNVVTINTTSVPPLLTAGVVTFVDLPSFIRGDANTDTVVNIADGVFLLQYLFNGGATPVCFSAADVTDDGTLDVSDFIRLLLFQFLGGPAPSSPFPNCGVDSTSDLLSCLAFPPC